MFINPDNSYLHVLKNKATLRIHLLDINMLMCCYWMIFDEMGIYNLNPYNKMESNGQTVVLMKKYKLL
jgi:hypothetical protein